MSFRGAVRRALAAPQGATLMQRLPAPHVTVLVGDARLEPVFRMSNNAVKFRRPVPDVIPFYPVLLDRAINSLASKGDEELFTRKARAVEKIQLVAPRIDRGLRNARHIAEAPVRTPIIVGNNPLGGEIPELRERQNWIVEILKIAMLNCIGMRRAREALAESCYFSHKPFDHSFMPRFAGRKPAELKAKVWRSSKKLAVRELSTVIDVEAFDPPHARPVFVFEALDVADALLENCVAKSIQNCSIARNIK